MREIPATVCEACADARPVTVDRVTIRRCAAVDASIAGGGVDGETAVACRIRSDTLAETGGICWCGASLVGAPDDATPADANLQTAFTGDRPASNDVAASVRLAGRDRSAQRPCYTTATGRDARSGRSAGITPGVTVYSPASVGPGVSRSSRSIASMTSGPSHSSGPLTA
ncbi:MAG: hypothetical protein QNJ91_12710 [Gammaproteobacteria bacterium]|nr:hypothetical protein [Gammaproteobacteria bacterium]